VQASQLTCRPGMILLDLDGTLVDTVPDLAYAVDIMMAQLGLPVCGEPRVRRWIGNGAERLVRRALTGADDGEPDDALFERAYPLFLEAYEAHVCHLSRPYPGVLAGLDRLQQAGYPLGCVTNKPACFTEPLLAQLDLTQYFQITISGDTLTRKKPDPAPLLHAADFFATPPAQSLMVGDSINDVQAARAAGFLIVCVSYGYNHGMDIRESSPDAVIDSLEQLPQLLPAQA